MKTPPLRHHRCGRHDISDVDVGTINGQQTRSAVGGTEWFQQAVVTRTEIPPVVSILERPSPTQIQDLGHVLALFLGDENLFVVLKKIVHLVIRHKSTTINGVSGFRGTIVTITTTEATTAIQPAAISAFRVTPFGFMYDVIDIPNIWQSILYQSISRIFVNMQTIHPFIVDRKTKRRSKKAR